MSDMKPVEKRDFLFDNMRLFLIFWVVTGHLLELFMKGNAFYTALHAVIYSFHMPLFVFVSGYFTKSTKKSRRDSIGTLLIPYLLFTTAASAISGTLTPASLFTPQYAFWYFLSLFYWRFFSGLFKKPRLLLPLSILLALMAGLVPQINRFLGLSRTLVFLPFFLMGMCWSAEDTKRIRRVPKALATAGAVCCAVCTALLSLLNIVPNELYRQAQSYADSGLSNGAGLLFRSISLLIASAMIFAAVNLTPDKETKFSYIGQRTVTIFALHALLVVLVKRLFPDFLYTAARSPLILPAVLLLSAACIWIFSRKHVVSAYKHIFGFFPLIFEKKKK